MDKFLKPAVSFLFYLAGQTASAQTFDHNGITVDTKKIVVTIGGRLHLDTVSVSDDVTPFRDKTDIRRLRIYATLNFNNGWRLKVDSDVGGLSTGLKNVWVAYGGIKNTSFKVGSFVAPVLGEKLKSSNDLKLIERSLASTLASGFLLGGGVTYRAENVTLSAGYFGNPASSNKNQPANDGKSVVGRVIWAPIHEKRKTIFVAGSIENRQLKPGARSRVRTKPEFGLFHTRLIGTRKLRGLESYTNYIGETGFGYGPFMAKVQYISRFNYASALGDPIFKGASFETALVLTGERQRFSLGTGTFGRVRPKRKFGAVEIAGRLSTLDLEDGLVKGGKETNYTIGVNWYLNRNVRLMANYVHAKTRPGSNGLHETPEAVISRLQVAF
ncbi:MAG: porin [Robiginitomaculum sp.]|nr:porin [Robiginitomaculum sp.]